MKKSDLTTQEVKLLLKMDGITIKPAYHHNNYLYTSFTMPYPLKAKLDRIAKEFELTRSRVVQLLLIHASEKHFLKQLKQYKFKKGQ